MPYNTRRKSLSLPLLGIQLPQSSRASVANRSAPVPPPPPPPSSVTSAEPPPSKRVKRSHSSPSSPPSPSNPTTTTTTSTAVSTATSPKTSRRNAAAAAPSTAVHDQNTPPPSPRPLSSSSAAAALAACHPRVDVDGIGDEIVVSVIRQLERTGNKPQLVKELAAVLVNTLDVVESSANPQAIISSRLNAYLKRPWTALSPCPVAKTLIPTHPRRIYYYLTNRPHQPLPAFSSGESPLPSNRRAIISPSLSSDDDQDGRRRAALSPSPEVDLSVPDDGADEMQGPPTPAGSSFSGRSSLSRDGSHPDAEVMSRRVMSPPLEGDEREFTRTASAMQSKRSFSADASMTVVDDGGHAHPQTIRTSIEEDDGGAGPALMGGRGGSTAPESEEHAERRHSEAAATLFGPSTAATTMTTTGASASAAGMTTSGGSMGMSMSMSMSSPMVRPMTMMGLSVDTGMSMSMSPMKKRLEMDMEMVVGEEMMMLSPENVELAELDDLLGGF